MLVEVDPEPGFLGQSAGDERELFEVGPCELRVQPCAAVPGGQDEDDGYLMTYVHNPERGAADLVIVAAQDFTGAPVARIHLPVRVPLGLHGSWVPDPP